MTVDDRPAPDVAPWCHRRSPAHDLTEAMQHGSCVEVRLREVPFLTQIALRVWPGEEVASGLKGILGAGLPRGVGGVVSTPDGLALLWLGPDEFLAVGPDEVESGVRTDQLVDRLTGALGTARGQVVDVSANRVTLELSGPSARAVLEKSVRIDLHPRVFAVGSAAVTPLDTTPAIIWRTEEESWRVLVRASFAEHAVAWLLDGMREYL